MNPGRDFDRYSGEERREAIADYLDSLTEHADVAAPTAPKKRGFFENPAIPPPLKVVAFFGLPVLFVGCVAVAIWAVSHFTGWPNATVVVFDNLPLAGAVICFAFRKITPKELLFAVLLFGVVPNSILILGGIVWLIRGY